MASPILCTTTACGRPAAYMVVQNGHTVGYACDKCSINANGQDLLRRRKDQEERANDIERVGYSLARLGRLRSKVFSVTPLELSTATLRIGRNFSENGEDAAEFIDKTIDELVVLLQRIRAGDVYNMDIAATRMARLRDGLAADASLDAFDALVGPDMQRIVPDDARQLMAYRANPVQTIAELTTEYGASNIRDIIQSASRLVADYYIIGFFQRIAIDFNGRLVNTDELDRPYGRPFFCHAFEGSWYRPDARTIYHDSDPAVVYPIPDSMNLYRRYVVARGHYLCCIYDEARSIKCRVFRADKASRTIVALSEITIYDNLPEAKPLAVLEPPGSLVPFRITGSMATPLSAHVARIAIDANGNLWHINKPAQFDTGDAVIVRNLSGVRIASVSIPGCFAVSAGADGVWVASASSDVLKFTNMRLVPLDAYSHGM